MDARDGATHLIRALLARAGIAAAVLSCLLLGPAPAAFAQEEITVSAAEQEWVADTGRFSGTVRIQYQDIRVACDEMELNRATKDLVARGSVVLDQGPRRIAADELHYNLGTKTGIFYNATGTVAPFYVFTGSVVEKLDETRYLLTDATFTSCDPGERPPWQFTLRKALIEEDGYGHFHGTGLRIKGVPIFYLPYLVWPVKQDRTPGLLMPKFGFSEQRGTFLGIPVYIPLGRSWDTTIELDYYSEGYYGLDTELRWAPAANTAGEIDLFAIYDEGAAEWQWKVEGTHKQSDFLGFRFSAQVEDLSDPDFFQEFELDFDENTRRQVFSYGYLTRSLGPYTLNLRADTRTTFLTSGDIVLRQLPEVELRAGPTRVGRSPLYWTLISSANLFNVDRGGDLKATYGRFDLFPSIAYTLPGPAWLTVTPRLGGRATYWTARLAENRASYEDESIERAYLAAGLDVVGPSVSRIFDRPFGSEIKLKHLIEPRIEYGYVSDLEDQAFIPTFDEVDSVLVTNRARITLANRLFVRSADGAGSAREVASLELYQDYSFDEPLVFSRDRTLSSQSGPLGLALRVTPMAGATLDLRSAYSTFFDSLQSASLSTSLSGKLGYGALTWYSSYNPETGDRTSSQIRTLMNLGGRGKPVNLAVHLSYDLEAAELQQQRYVLGYQGSCWAVAVEYRDFRLGIYPARDYRIVFDLKGIGQLLEIRGGLDD